MDIKINLKKLNEKVFKDQWTDLDLLVEILKSEDRKTVKRTGNIEIIKNGITERYPVYIMDQVIVVFKENDTRDGHRKKLKTWIISRTLPDGSNDIILVSDDRKESDRYFQRMI